MEIQIYNMSERSHSLWKQSPKGVLEIGKLLEGIYNGLDTLKSWLCTHFRNLS